MSVPVVNFAHYTHGTPAQREAFINEVGNALATFGFVSVDNHTVDLALLEDAYTLAGQTFALDRATKVQYENPEGGRQRGYTSMGIEHAKDKAVADLKEFWQIGRTLDADHPLHQSGDVPPNVFPAENPAFGPHFETLFSQMENFANQLLDVVGIYLGLEPDFFRTMVGDGNSVLRVIHYPPLSNSASDGAVRAAQHEDINLITVLPASTEGGLELLTHDGEWIAISPPAGVMVCDTGDMMALLTNNKLTATTHRVVNPPGEAARRSRFSMPFFVHPGPGVRLNPNAGPMAEPIYAKEFLQKRLEEIGVTKS